MDHQQLLLSPATPLHHPHLHHFPLHLHPMMTTDLLLPHLPQATPLPPPHHSPHHQLLQHQAILLPPPSPLPQVSPLAMMTMVHQQPLPLFRAMMTTVPHQCNPLTAMALPT